jgi:hypothetical protein
MGCLQMGYSWMGYLQMGYVQVQCSVSCSDSWCLKLVREISVSSFSDFCNSLQSLALGVTSIMYLVERVLRVGTATVTSELRKGGLYQAKTYR